MARTIRIGGQDFERIRVNNNFYIDKTDFIKKWWEAEDDVTLITRPRRFGKTLNMSMLEQFFSVKYAGRGELFEGLSIWQDEKYRQMQGTWPVLSISFARVKENTFREARRSICRIIEEQYNKNEYLLKGDLLNEKERAFYQEVTADMSDSTAAASLRAMADFLCKYHGKKAIILLDEYDTPMQEAYVSGYWEEMVAFIRSLFNAAFKTNPYLERALLTGITRVSKESIFSDLNNLEVVTTVAEKYEECFGFTEKEVFAALEEYGLSNQKQKVKDWYDGFTFGEKSDIYNPWSIINYLDKKKVGAYWANTSSNSLVGKLLREGDASIKQAFEDLLYGGKISMEIDEQIVYNQLAAKKNAVWSLLLASGYLKVANTTLMEETGRTYYDLALTNREVTLMFEIMIQDWFSGSGDYNDFIKALLQDDVDAMNEYMNRVAFDSFSYFDTGKNPGRTEPEKFYHGFVLGLMVDLSDRYLLRSNRESGFGRYDVMLEPKRAGEDAFILEFKVFQPRKEKDLEETVASALAQIEEKGYAAELLERGIPAERIRRYGFAFCGKEVLIGGGK